LIPRCTVCIDEAEDSFVGGAASSRGLDVGFHLWYDEIAPLRWEEDDARPRTLREDFFGGEVFVEV
jgi:hypothetical protein